MSQAWYITVHIASRRRLEILNKYWNSHHKQTGPTRLSSATSPVTSWTAYLWSLSWGNKYIACRNGLTGALTQDDRKPYPWHIWAAGVCTSLCAKLGLHFTYRLTLKIWTKMNSRICWEIGLHWLPRNSVFLGVVGWRAVIFKDFGEVLLQF